MGGTGMAAGHCGNAYGDGDNGTIQQPQQYGGMDVADLLDGDSARQEQPQLQNEQQQQPPQLQNEQQQQPPQQQ